MSIPSDRVGGGEAVVVAGRRGGTPDWPAEMWYFGDDPDRSLEIPAGSCADRTSIAAQRLGEHYRQLDAHLTILDRDDWDCSNVGERSHYTDTLLLDCARMMAFLEAVRAGGRHMAVVDDPVFAWMVYRAARTQNLAVWWAMPGRSAGWSDRLRVAAAGIRTAIADLRSLAGCLRATLRRLAILRRLRRAQPVAVAPIARADAILTLWTDARTFIADEAVPRRSTFGPLPQALADAGLRCAYLAMPLSWVGDFGEIARRTLDSGHPVLLLEDCWTPAMVIRTALACLAHLPAAAASWMVDGTDLSPLVARALARERFQWRRVHAHLCAQAGRTLRGLGARPTAVIAPFENQSWEKALRAGFKHALPDTEYVACQLSLFDPDYHSFFATRADIARNRIPDRLLTMGPHFTALFAANGFPTGRMTEIGALRYPPLADAITLREPTTAPRILCGTSIELDESLELAHVTVAAVGRLDGARAVINFHPVTDAPFREALRRSLESRLGPVMDRVEFSTAPAAALLETADAVVYNTSGVAFDALAKGVPAVYVRRELGLDHDKVADDIAIRVRGPDQLASVLAELTSGRRRLDARAVDHTIRQSLGTVALTSLPKFLINDARASD